LTCRSGSTSLREDDADTRRRPLVDDDVEAGHSEDPNPFDGGKPKEDNPFASM
jgi:hypothetical protein